MTFVSAAPSGLQLAAVKVDLDQTVVIAFVVFLALVLLLKPLLFDPMLKVFELREKKTDGVREEAREMQEKAGELLRKYERELEKVSRIAAEEREKLRQETARLEAQILGEARAAAAAIVDEGRKAMEAELSQAKAELKLKAQGISREIASSVLGREVN
jgi:F-type H+-transporting ATPase subunit b